MAERVQHRRATTRDEEAAVETTVTPRQAVDYNAILDEIDTVLEADAQEYVRSFVQKGGQ